MRRMARQTDRREGNWWRSSQQQRIREADEQLSERLGSPELHQHELKRIAVTLTLHDSSACCGAACLACMRVYCFTVLNLLHERILKMRARASTRNCFPLFPNDLHRSASLCAAFKVLVRSCS